MDKSVNYPQLLEKLATEPKTSGNIPQSRLSIIRGAKEKFIIWLNQYADAVAQMVEKYETAKITEKSTDIADNIFNQTLQSNDVERPKADINKICADIVSNWYRCLVWTVDSTGSRKARRKIWLELVDGKFKTAGTARMLRDAMIAIEQSYR